MLEVLKIYNLLAFGMKDHKKVTIRLFKITMDPARLRGKDPTSDNRHRRSCLNHEFRHCRDKLLLWPIKYAKAKKAGILNPVLHHSGIPPDQDMARAPAGKITNMESNRCI